VVADAACGLTLRRHGGNVRRPTGISGRANSLDLTGARVYKVRCRLLKQKLSVHCSRLRGTHQVVVFSSLEVSAFRAQALL